MLKAISFGLLILLRQPVGDDSSIPNRFQFCEGTFYRELVGSSTILLSALESKKQEPERTFPVCHVQALDNLSKPVLDLATGLFSPVSV